MEDPPSDTTPCKTTQEADLLLRSNKKFKRKSTDDLPRTNVDTVMEDPSTAVSSHQFEPTAFSTPRRTFKDMLASNNPHFQGLSTRQFHDPDEDDNDCSDDELLDPTVEEDPCCPTIKLTKDQKKRLRRPWRNALIIKMFDKGVGFMQLQKRLKAKWSLKGDFSLIDIGCDYFVTRFTNMEDYHHVLNQGPWLIGDNYLTIRKWVPNFIPDEEPIKRLTAWIRIPNISVEYFDYDFLKTIGEKVGKVNGIDQTMANVERGRFTRLSMEVDLSKPLLSKFRLHGRIWKIQYEGIKLLCFKCGKIGHREDFCPANPPPTQSTQESHSPSTLATMEIPQVTPPPMPAQRPEVSENFGSWMLVKKPQKKKMTKQGDAMAANRTGETGSGPTRKANETRRQPDPGSEKGNSRNHGVNHSTIAQNSGSRFQILGDALNENHGQSLPERRTLSGKASTEDNSMETETPSMEGEAMQENLPPLIPRVSLQLHPQIFAFSGRNTATTPSSSRFHRPPLAPRNNRNIGPCRPSQTSCPPRGPAHGGPKQPPKGRGTSDLNSPLNDPNKTVQHAIPPAQQPNVTFSAQPSGERTVSRCSISQEGLPATQSPLHSNDPPSNLDSLSADGDTPPPGCLVSAGLATLATTSRQLMDADDEIDAPRDNSSLRSPPSESEAPSHD